MRGAAAIVVLLAVAVPAAAVPEGDAGRVWLEQNGRPGIVAAGHTPESVQAGTQWEGYLVLADNVTFESVRFQICRVGLTCFAPPTPAEQADARTWRFNTTDYRASGSGALIDWGAGWHVGVRYVIEDRLANGTLRTTVFPESDDLTAAGAELHYLTLDIEGQVEKRAPTVPAAILVLGLACMAGLRRR